MSTNTKPNQKPKSLAAIAREWKAANRAEAHPEFARHALTNAARIGLQVGVAETNGRNALELVDDITDAARALATVETVRGFAWNEDPAVDWESVCEVLAQRVGRGLPVTVGSVRRVIAELGAGGVS